MVILYNMLHTQINEKQSETGGNETHTVIYACNFKLVF